MPMFKALNPEAVKGNKNGDVSKDAPLLRAKIETVPSSGVIIGVPGYVMKSKVVSGKVFVNVLFDDSVRISGVILGDNCPHPVPDKEGNMSDTYDVCINSRSRNDDFNRDVSCLC